MEEGWWPGRRLSETPHLCREAAGDESELPQGRKSGTDAGKQAQCFGLEKKKSHLAHEQWFNKWGGRRRGALRSEKASWKKGELEPKLKEWDLVCGGHSR